MGLSPIFDLAARALSTQEIVLRTAGHNLANVDRPGYSRQEVLVIDAPPQQQVGVAIGSGVTVDGIRQIVDPLLEQQLLAARGRSAEASASRDELTRLEQLFVDLDGGGLAGVLDDFFGAASDLALHPEGIPERSTWLARADALAARLRDRATQVGELQRQVDDRILVAVPRVNGLLTDIARLNGQIFDAELGTESANDLRDERRIALGELGKLIGISQFETPQGITVVGSNGILLVDGRNASEVVADGTTPPILTALDGRGLARLAVRVASGALVPIDGAVSGGGIGGLLAIRDGELPGVAADLDTLAGALRDAVNAVHGAGEDLDGNPGAALFGGAGARDLTVLITDPRLVAASAPTTLPAPTTPEDNRNALALAALATTPLDGTAPGLGGADLGGQAFIGYLSTVVGGIGSRSETASTRAEAAEALTHQVENQRHAISGVNTNEELLTLLDAQRAFQAAATLVGVATATIDTLLEMLG
jgi:flagellar hook-associated protein 1 FlgK